MIATAQWQVFLQIGGAIFFATFIVGVILVSTMCRLSWRLGAVDKPDGTLKCHVRPTATLGGVPLFATILIGASILFAVVHGLSGSTMGRSGWSLTWGSLLVAGFIIMCMGICDDMRKVEPRTKLLFQIMAAMALIGSGIVIRRFGFFGMFEQSLGMLAVPFTLFWIVGSCNAFNFIDGLDGLASGIGVVIAITLATLGFVNGAYGPALCSLIVAGALLAIVLFNIKPACIFLGDSGSQLLGLLLGALAIETTTAAGVFQLPAAGIILSVPVFDALLSILRRYSKAESMALGDHKHIHHCLRRLGLSVRQVSMVVWMIVILCGGMAYLCQTETGYSMAAASVLFIGLLLYGGIRLGCLDLRRLYARLTGRMKPSTTSPTYQIDGIHSLQDGKKTNQLAEVEVLWERMKPMFEQMHLDRAVLTLEGVGENGRSQRETYQWVRSKELMAELLRSRWTKRFSLDEQRVATLLLESVDKTQQDEEHIEMLIKQISRNMRTVRELQNKSKPETIESSA
jgi:UDP-GlcNAc:undecaprenyl-phosphate/decaprenyl-phosphate GlcNAc-1-phosphate transferase